MSSSDGTTPPVPKPRLTRTSTPRSRGGCFTCRRRRVKCGEEQPQCFRCIKLGVTCEGYRSVPKQRGLVNIEPKAKLVKAQPKGIIANETDLENRYLRHFQQATESRFYSTTDWSLWNRLVMQTSHHEPFVRHGVIAIGALNKSLQASYPWGPDAAQSTPDLKIAKLHKEFAYVQYQKALTLMQKVLNSSANPRQALIACLLVVCFETFSGERHIANAHAETGLRILSQWEKKNFAWSSNNLMSVESPAPEVVEDEIVEAFANLDIKIATVSDPRSRDTHQLRIEEDSKAVAEMPSAFSDLLEARKYWGIVMRRACHFLATTWSPTKSMSLSRDFILKPPADPPVMTGVNIFSTSYEVTDELIESQKTYATEISKWSEAFDPLLSSTKKADPADFGRYIVTTSLRIQCLAASILMAGVLFTEEILYDGFYPQFKAMLNLMDNIAATRHRESDHSSFWNGGFLIDLGIVPCLFIIVNRCRDSVLRRRAVEILKGWQMEGAWDPRLITVIGQFMMEVEEEGMVDGHIPETSRAIFSRISQNPNTRISLLQCVLKTGGPDGGKLWKEKLVYW